MQSLYVEGNNKVKCVWLLGMGEPLIIDGENVRLRRLGSFAEFLSEDSSIELHYFSISFEHYNKYQRVDSDKTFKIKNNYFMHIVRVPGYKKNISLDRIITHKLGSYRIVKWMSRIAPPDVVYCGNTPLELVDRMVKYANKKNIPTIVDIRDLWPEVYRDSLPDKYHKILEPYIQFCKRKMRKTYKNVTSFIGVSDYFLDYALKLAGRNRTELDRIIPIGYPDYSFNCSIENFNDLWGMYGLSTTDFIIAFTGNFGNQFCFTEIIEAAKLLGDRVKFVLCGKGIQEETLKKESPPNIIYPGWIEKEMIISLLEYSSLGIAPYINSINYQTNTPNKFGEYLSAGLPILVRVDGVMANILSLNACGYYYQNGEDLADIIRSLVDNLALTEMKYKARSLYEDSFNLSKANNSLRDLFFRVMKKGEIK